METRLSALAPPLRVLVTCVVVTMLATVALGEALVLRDNRLADGDPSLSVRDLQMRFTGGHANLLEARSRNEMRQYFASGDELARVVGWTKSGALEEEYREQVAPLIDERCLRCHYSGGQASFRPLDTFERVRAVAVAPPGPLLSRQILVTKVHLIGIGLLLGLTSFLFSMSGVPAVLQMAAPLAGFGGLVLDFASWWLMRADLAFAWGRMFGNALMLTSFLGMCAAILVSVWRRTRTGASST